LIKLVGLLEPTLLVAMAAIVGFINDLHIAPIIQQLFRLFLVLAAG
jgi:type II secretory pathway component PulF